MKTNYIGLVLSVTIITGISQEITDSQFERIIWGLTDYGKPTDAQLEAYRSLPNVEKRTWAFVDKILADRGNRDLLEATINAPVVAEVATDFTFERYRGLLRTEAERSKTLRPETRYNPFLDNGEQDPEIVKRAAIQRNRIASVCAAMRSLAVAGEPSDREYIEPFAALEPGQCEAVGLAQIFLEHMDQRFSVGGTESDPDGEDSTSFSAHSTGEHPEIFADDRGLKFVVVLILGVSALSLVLIRFFKMRRK